MCYEPTRRLVLMFTPVSGCETIGACEDSGDCMRMRITAAAYDASQAISGNRAAGLLIPEHLSRAFR
jgi:hypothetical protein